MKSYCKLCGHLFGWLWKPLRRVLLGLCAAELLLALARLDFYSSFSNFLNDRGVLLCAGAAFAAFLLLAQRHFHQLYTGSRGIYTMAVLPAPGWAFPAAAYTTCAVCILSIAAVQILLAALVYPCFLLCHSPEAASSCALRAAFQSPREPFPLALLRANLFQYLLPLTPLAALRSLLLLEAAAVIPFTFMSLGARPAPSKYSPVSPDRQAELRGVWLAALLLFWIADAVIHSEVVKYAAACLLFAAGAAWELYTRCRPGKTDRF